MPDTTRKTVVSVLIITFVLLGILVCSAESRESGLTHLAAASTSGQSVTVLVYHHIVEDSESGYIRNGTAVTLDEFRAQMAYIASQGYSTISVQQLAGWLLDNEPLPPKPVLITFDDGYDSVYRKAYPVLRELGMQATLFVVGSFTCHHNVEAGEDLWYLSWSQIRDMVQTGHIDVQSHTFAAHLHTEDGKIPYAVWGVHQVIQDIARMEELLRMHALPSALAIAYPWGVCGGGAFEAVVCSSLLLGFGVEPGRVTRDSPQYMLPRLIIFPGTDLSRFARIVSDDTQFCW